MSKPKLYIIEVQRNYPQSGYKLWHKTFWTSFPNSHEQGYTGPATPVRLSRARYCLKVAQNKWPEGVFRIVEANHA